MQMAGNYLGRFHIGVCKFIANLESVGILPLSGELASCMEESIGKADIDIHKCK